MVEFQDESSVDETKSNSCNPGRASLKIAEPTQEEEPELEKTKKSLEINIESLQFVQEKYNIILHA